MAMDIHRLGDRKCYACIQWDGYRSFDHDAKTIKTDVTATGRCLLHHASTRGTHRCDQFSSLR